MTPERNIRAVWDGRAASPAIGVILMIAVTIVLAAITGAFVLDAGGGIGSRHPSATFSFEFDQNGNAPERLTVVHEGGETLARSRLSIVVGGTVAWEQGTPNWPWTEPDGEWDMAITAGSIQTLQDGSDGGSGFTEIDDGEEVRVVWHDPESDRTATIARTDVEL